MVINENGLITESQNTSDNNKLENTSLDNTIDSINKINENFDLNSNNQIIANSIYEETTPNNDSSENISVTIDEEELLENLDVPTSSDEKNIFEDSNITATSDEKETVETNCLALTVRKDYNFAIAKNTVFKTIRMSIKVAISTFVLNLIKLFF